MSNPHKIKLGDVTYEKFGDEWRWSVPQRFAYGPDPLTGVCSKDEHPMLDEIMRLRTELLHLAAIELHGE